MPELFTRLSTKPFLTRFPFPKFVLIFISPVLPLTKKLQAEARKRALVALTKHEGFRAAHPREDHFVPLYVAAGAGGEGRISILSALYGAPTVAFGL